MKRILLWMLIIVFTVSLSFMGSGCKPEAEEIADELIEEAEEVEEVPAEEAEVAQKVTITFWKYVDENEQPTFEKLINDFNSQSKTTEVILEPQPWDQYVSGEKIITSLAAGSGPDVFWLSAASFLNYVVSELLLPINDTFTEDLRADFLPESLRAVTVGGNGQLYVVIPILWCKAEVGAVYIAPPSKSTRMS